MIISIIINVILVLIGYFIGLKTAKEEFEKMINNNKELQDAWRRYLIEQAEEAEGDAEAPPEASEAEETAEAPEAEETAEAVPEGAEVIDGRVFKSFNLYSNIGATEEDQKKH